MRLDDLQTGMVITGQIVSSTASAPSVPESVSYTVSMNLEDGPVQLAGVAPQRYSRWTSYMPLGDDGEEPLLNPFPPGHKVMVHVERRGDGSISLIIADGEVPAFGGCP